MIHINIYAFNTLGIARRREEVLVTVGGSMFSSPYPPRFFRAAFLTVVFLMAVFITSTWSNVYFNRNTVNETSPGCPLPQPQSHRQHQLRRY